MNVIEGVKHLFLQADAAWILWLLGCLSVISVAIAVERWIFFRSVSAQVRDLAVQLDEWLAHDQIDTAIAQLRELKSVAAAIALAGLRLSHRGPQAAEKAMASATALERERLERWLSYLGTVGNNAPFVGLFGTVIGVIHAFEELGHGVAGHAESAAAAGQVASQAVMASIAEALVATAVGIFVALPAVAAYNYFQRRMQAFLGESEALSNLVLAYLATESQNETVGKNAGGR